MRHEGAGARRFDPRRLPEFAPGPALWTRIAAAQQRRVARRRWRAAVFGTAIAASVAAALLVGGRLAVAPIGPLAPGATTTAMQGESRALEGEWHRLVGAKAAALGSTRLRAIDAELQSAYDRGAGADELVSLWQQRNRALRGLIASVQDGAYGRAASVTQL